MKTLYIDADGCSAGARAMAMKLSLRGAQVVLVGDRDFSRVAADSGYDPAALRCARVEGGQDAADAYIADAIRPGDALVTRDITLAKIALEKGALAASDHGEIYDAATVDARLVAARARSDMRSLSAEVDARASRKNRSVKEAKARAEKLARFFDAWLRASS